MTNARYIEPLQVIALINDKLTQYWPATRFDVYGPDIDNDIFVMWGNGPGPETVRTILSQFDGADLDEDTYNYRRRPCQHDGELVQFGINRVICGRLADMGQVKRTAL